MKYNLTKLKNGVRVLMVPMPSNESSTITIWVKVGSRFEEERVAGISHFLEHMVFKGSPKYPGARIVTEAIDSLGAENNAGTSKEWTNFYIKTANINLEKAFDILADTVLNPQLLQEEIEKERGVILQEIAMYEDTPIMSIGEEFEKLIYEGSSLGRKIAGDEKSLVNIDHGEFKNYRRKHYIAENILVSVAGGADTKKVRGLAEKYFSELAPQVFDPEAQTRRGEALKGSPLQGNSSIRGRTSNKAERVFLKEKKTDQTHLILGFLCEGRGYKGRFAQSVLTTILGRGMSSRLFTEVREKRGLAYSVHASQDRYADIGSFDVYAGVKTDKAEEAIKVVLDQIYGISEKKYEVDKKEFAKAKSYLKGRLALRLEDSDAVNDYFSEQVLFDKEILTPKEVYKKVDEVEVDEVYAEAKKIFKKDGVYLTVIGPYNSSDQFTKLLF